MKRNPGRPALAPTKPVVTLTLRVTKEFKEKLMAQAAAVDLSLTAYIECLVNRDSTTQAVNEYTKGIFEQQSHGA